MLLKQLVEECSSKKLMVRFAIMLLYLVRFNESQRKWSAIETNCFGIVYSILALHGYLFDQHFILRTDHRNLKYLHAGSSAKLTRWRLRLQDYHFTVEHIPGRDNLIPDVMSRLISHDDD